jgi:hypothetical protein
MQDRNVSKISHHPSQQIYTPPVDIVHLPSEGKFYPEEHPLHKKETVEVYFMTTKEEDILVNAAYNSEGIVYEKLVESILVNKSIKPASLLSGDRNAILISARANAYGPDYEVRVPCQQCLAMNQISLDLSGIEEKKTDYSNVEITSNGTFLLKLPKSGIVAEIKLLTGQDEKEMEAQTQQRAKHKLPEEGVTGRYSRMVVSINGSTDPIAIKQFVSNMPIADSRIFRKTYLNLMPDVDFVYKFPCRECSHVNKGGVPFTGDFFWPDE